uniref:Uncharacterized protein n=1 Tax=Malurus cyaneus samueli TaxID=2593467 RepID=A0A8C5U7N6_9PASS
MIKTNIFSLGSQWETAYLKLWLALPAPAQGRAGFRSSLEQLSGPWAVRDLLVRPGCGSSVCLLPAEMHICLHPNLGRLQGDGSQPWVRARAPAWIPHSVDGPGMEAVLLPAGSGPVSHP